MPVAGEQQRRRMAGEPQRQRRARSGAIVTMHSVVNIHGDVALVAVHDLQRRQQRRRPRRPPSTSVRHAIRRQTPSAAASGPWPRDVADHRVHACRRRVLDRVVEVAAEQRAPAARAVVRGELERRVA